MVRRGASLMQNDRVTVSVDRNEPVRYYCYSHMQEA